MYITPPYLQPGDTIGLVCPAGFMPIEKAATCIDRLRSWGYTVKVGDTVGGHSTTYFSGTDEERRRDFQSMIDNDDIKAILCARGGYGTGRIIESLHFKSLKKHPKWVIGFSDVTVLHCHLLQQHDLMSLHAPMAAAFNDEPENDPYTLSLKNALEGVKAKYNCEVHPLNRRGEAIGTLVGGNLSLLAHLTGTDDELKTRGKILFIEDVGEYTYNIDRMMYQLKRAGSLSKLAGLIVGGFTDMKDTERPFGHSVYDCIHALVAEYDYPVCFGFPVSHGRENVALKVGSGYKLKVGKSKVVLED
jgi:muramoyltetrapeptide carboxypeptidase